MWQLLFPSRKMLLLLLLRCIILVNIILFYCVNTEICSVCYCDIQIKLIKHSKLLFKLDSNCWKQFAWLRSRHWNVAKNNNKSICKFNQVQEFHSVTMAEDNHKATKTLVFYSDTNSTASPGLRCSERKVEPHLVSSFAEVTEISAMRVTGWLNWEQK